MKKNISLITSNFTKRLTGYLLASKYLLAFPMMLSKRYPLTKSCMIMGKSLTYMVFFPDVSLSLNNNN